MQATGQLKELLYTGVASRDALEVLVVIDGLIDKNRAQATQGPAMDITLEATLKAGIDAVSRGVNPENTRLEFANNTPVIDLINALKQGKRFDTPDLEQMSRVKGFAWGTYSFAPSCRGDLLVTLHVVLPRGETVNFQAQGRPEQVMAAIALQMVRHFQRTSFPTLISMGEKFIVLVGAPGTSINTAPTPKVAEQACKAIKARLPTESGYDFYRSWATGTAASRCATSSGRCPITTSCRPTPATLLPCATPKRSTAPSFLFTACADLTRKNCAAY